LALRPLILDYGLNRDNATFYLKKRCEILSTMQRVNKELKGMIKLL